MRPLLPPLALALALSFGCSNAPPAASPAQTPTQTAGQPAATPSAEVTPTTGNPIRPDCATDFDAFDANKDGFLSFDEFSDGRYSRIRYIKAPTPEEEANMRASLRQEGQKADANGDGKLSREEFATTCAS